MNLTRRSLLVGTAAAALSPGRAPAAAAVVPPGVYTRSFDTSRSGHWPHETILTQDAVRTRGMVLKRTLPLYGDARGSEGQPLIVPGVKMADGSTRNVLVTATMADWVQGWDADTGAELWKVSVGKAIDGSRQWDLWLVNQRWGVLSTPVINSTTGTIHLCAMTSADDSFTDATFWLHSISPRDGSDVLPPLDLSTATYQPPNGLPLQQFTAAVRKQRSGLALSADGSTVFVCTGSFLESSPTNRSFILACDVSTAKPEVAAAFTTCVTGSGAGVWMGSEAPVIDPEGCLLVVTANGDFNAAPGVSDNWGESLLRLRYTKASGTTAASIAVIDHFTPYTDTGRGYGAAYQTLPSLNKIPRALAVRDAADPMPTNAMRMMGITGSFNHNSAPAQVNMLSANDEDLGSAGVLYVPASQSGLTYNLAIFGGKDGVIYVADGDGMNGANLADFAPSTIQAKVYANLLCPPFWGTYYNPASPAPTDLGQLQTVYQNRTHHIHSQAVFYKSPALGPCIYVMGENGNLRCFGLSNADTTGIRATYLGCTQEYASPDAPVVQGQLYGGMPGGFISVSSNNNAVGSGLLHVLYPRLDSNRVISPGVYAIFDPDNLGRFADGSGWIKKLWSSADWGIQFTHCKFARGTPWRGNFYHCTYGGTLNQFSLAPR
nr:hypothetical protein [uncultured Lichenicoccus sp.]